MARGIRPSDALRGALGLAWVLLVALATFYSGLLLGLLLRR